MSSIDKAWYLHSRSPFISRLQSWPRGYPGDFETIESLVQQINRATPGTEPYKTWIEYLANWHLIERTQADIEHLVVDACGALLETGPAALNLV